MTTPIDIRADHLRIVQDVLAQHLPDGVMVWVFGSRATWATKDSSDLDLALEGDGEIPSTSLSALETAFKDSDLPFVVDVVDCTRIDQRFWGIVAKQRVPLLMADYRKTPRRLQARLDWRSTTLGQTVTLQRGFDLPIAERRPGAYPVVASTGPVGTHHQAMVAGPGVVVGRSGSLGGGQFIGTDFWPLNTTLWVKDFHANEPRYCYFLLKSLDLRRFNAGSGVPTLNRNHIHPLPVRVPPLHEQRAIAHVLGTLEDKIELNRRTNATLEAMAQALFRSWFVDFDPVRAKTERRDTRLPREVANLFPDRLVNSEVGEIPEGWPLVPLPELMDVNPSRPLRKGDVAPYLDMANMPTLGHAPDSVVRRPFGSGMRFVNGDTLVARITPCLENGKTAYVDFLRDDEIGWGSTEYIVMKPRHPLPSEFAYLLARTARFRDFAIQNMSGTSGRQRVSASALSEFSIPSPPAMIGAEFGRAAKLLLGRARAAVDECYVLANCRDTLLPKLISGETRVGDAEKFVGGKA